MRLGPTRRTLSSWAPDDAEQERLRRQFLHRLDAGPAALRRSGRPSHLTVSAVVLDRSLRSVLLVLHRTARLWLPPGGHLEDGDDSLAAAALREAVEETGIADLELLSEQPVHLEQHPAPCGAQSHLDVRFALLATAGAVPTVSEESLEVAWWDLDALPEQRGVDLSSLVRATLQR